MRRRAPEILALLLSVLALSSLAAPAWAGVRQVDTLALQALLADRGEPVFLLDVRTPREWSDGRVPGSVLIPMNAVPARLSEVPREARVVVVCATGARSAAVARFLDQRGYAWVANYTGGVFDWARRGLPIER